MVRKSDTPAYFASPASASLGAPERLPRIPGAILRNSSKPRPEPSPTAAESLPVSAWPRPDDYLDEPDEIHRWERIGDQRQETSPATADHGDPHFEIDALVKAHLAKGYVGSTDLKTRVSKKKEYASDTCVRLKGIDPTTGSRYLEELVFEVGGCVAGVGGFAFGCWDLADVIKRSWGWQHIGIDELPATTIAHEAPHGSS